MTVIVSTIVVGLLLILGAGSIACTVYRCETWVISSPSRLGITPHGPQCEPPR